MAYLIDIEGTDGSGKKTQANLLKNSLDGLGIKCKIVSFPAYDSISSGPVKMYLNGDFGNTADSLDAYQASSLYGVDRLCTMKLLEKESDDLVVILDRYTPSNMIHQATKILDEKQRDEFLQWVDNFEYNILKLPRPNIILFLDMPPFASIKLTHDRKELKTKTKNDIHESDENFLSRSYETGKNIALKFNWEIINCEDGDNNIKNIDAIHEEILAYVIKELKK